jgi:hypothetical protein
VPGKGIVCAMIRAVFTDLRDSAEKPDLYHMMEVSSDLTGNR